MQQQHRLWRSQSDSLARTALTVIWNDVDWAIKKLGLEDVLERSHCLYGLYGSAKNKKIEGM